jgi:hypothetical protein
VGHTGINACGETIRPNEEALLVEAGTSHREMRCLQACPEGYVHLNNLFTDLETGAQESVRINAIVALLYNTLGHTPTIIIFGALAALFVIWGIYQVATSRKEA